MHLVSQSFLAPLARTAARIWAAPLSEQADMLTCATDPRSFLPDWPGSHADATWSAGSSVWRQATTQPEQLLVHASHGNVNGIRQCLSDGVAVDTRSPGQATALMMAAQRGHEDAVSTLLEARASVNLRSLRGNSALLFALSAGHRTVAGLLREHGAE
mmetsp:Transcript_8283/g.18514  ORF Transcript_8283/g.18514 Transcript_8283/m.18514 type:complete len:158 (+) Transcript_8283:94-567(+)